MRYATTTIQWSDDIEGAAWVAAGLDQRAPGVGNAVPSGYEAYARVELNWTPSVEAVEPLIALLRRESPTLGCNADRCWFALAELYGWTGQAPDPGGGITLTPEEEALKKVDFNAFFNRLVADMDAGRRSKPPRAYQAPYPYRMLETDIRTYMLYRDPVERATAVGEAGGPVSVPDLWWPDDRMWFVGSDTDLLGTYVGGPRRLIDVILDESSLESVWVDPVASLPNEPL